MNGASGRRPGRGRRILYDTMMTNTNVSQYIYLAACLQGLQGPAAAAAAAGAEQLAAGGLGGRVPKQLPLQSLGILSIHTHI